MPWPSKALTAARQFLDRELQAGTSRQPLSIATLATRAGVSYSTMWKIVTDYRARGKLSGKYRVTAAGAGTRPDLDTQGESSYQRTVNRLTRDLLAGTIVRRGRLFHVKELVSRYAVTQRTLRRATAELCSEGLLLSRGRHYEYLPVVHRKRSTVVLIASPNAGSADMELPELETGFVRSGERTCAAMGAHLETVALRRGDGRTFLTGTHGGAAISLPDHESVAGYLYLLHESESFDRRLMESLLSTQRPVAIVDHASVFPKENRRFDAPMVRIFTASGGERPGREMARYILSKGHRRIAYISPFHADAWSINRARGIQRVVALAGERFGVDEFTKEYSAKTRDLANRASEHSQATYLLRDYEKWLREVPFVCRAESELLWRTQFPFMLFRMGMREVLWDLLEEACRRSSATAWIMANDFAAIVALDYCHQHHIRVPETIAVAGFDDTVCASNAGITTYSFNLPAVAAASVRFILYPFSGYWSKCRVTEIDGELLERQTTS
jgi:DNA-binding LacI/PurR family transcriptional regulator